MTNRPPAQEAVIREYRAAVAMRRPAIPLNEAAQLVGVAPDALRMRYRRGTVEGFRDDANRIFVYSDQLSKPAESKQAADPQPQHEELLMKIIGRLERMERFQETLLQLLNSTIHELIAGKRDEREWIDEISKQKNQPF